MARNQTFSVSLSLLTQNFNKGIKSVQNSLRSLRAQFQTLMGGIGIGLGFNELIDNAKQLDKVQTTLRNVSGSAEKYGENLKFVQELSKKYNQDLITLTGNYAKFYSAASYAGFALEEQQYVYESLARAATYFNLTADETNGVMLAVQQMISKGKVSSEELRRQLGERLPGAMNLAAKAMGVSTAELDKMIRNGNVLAKELLPLLASELNVLTQNIDVNSIQGLTAKLKNAFTDLVEKLNIGDLYKKALGHLTTGLEWITNNLKEIGTWLVGAIMTLGFKKAIDTSAASFDAFSKKLERDLERNTYKATKLQEKIERIAADRDITLTKDDAGGFQEIDLSTIDSKNRTQLSHAKDINKYIGQHKVLLGEIATTQGMINEKTKSWREHLGKKIGNSIKGIFKSLGSLGISAAISTIITLTIQWFRKLNEVKREVKNIKKELKDDLGQVSPEMSKTESLMLKGDESEVKRKLLITEINKILGRTGKLEFTIESTDEEINKALRERLENLKKINELRAKEQALAALQTKWKEQVGEGTNLNDLKVARANLEKLINADKPNADYIPPKDMASAMSNWTVSHTSDFNRLNKLNQLIDLGGEIEKLKKEISNIYVDEKYLTTGEGVAPPPDENAEKSKKLKEDYDKIQKEHNNKLRALNEQLADEVITKEDYDKALKDLYTSTLESIYALDNVNENEDAFAKAILDRVKGFEDSKVVQDKANETLKDYFKKALELKRQYVDGIITMDELDDELFNLREETVKAISSMGKLSENAAILADTYKKQKADRVKREIGELEAPKMGELDTTFNYKKETSEVYQENAEYIKDYAEQLDDYIEKLKEFQDDLSGTDLETLNSHIDTLETNLEQLTMSADSFAQAAKFAEVQEDIANMKTELAHGIWDNITGIAQAAERLTNSFKSLQETWDDPDASGWEKFITTFTTIISVIETIVSVVKTFNAAMKIAEALSLATAAAEGAQIPVKVQDAIATKAQAEAAKELAVAKHMAAAAEVPYPANIFAIGSTAAALAAAFAAIPKFAKGGIVAGSSTQGDRNLVRANAGEMILTKGQQGTLWGMLNGKSGKSSGNVEFKIRGSELVGVLNNYSKKISK